MTPSAAASGWSMRWGAATVSTSISISAISLAAIPRWPRSRSALSKARLKRVSRSAPRQVGYPTPDFRRATCLGCVVEGSSHPWLARGIPVSGAARGTARLQVEGRGEAAAARLVRARASVRVRVRVRVRVKVEGEW